MRPAGCSMIDETAGSRLVGDEAWAGPRSPGSGRCEAGDAVAWSPGDAASADRGVVASRTVTPAAAKSAARKADTGPEPSAVNSTGPSPQEAGPEEGATASSMERERATALSAA